ncbi:MAG: hypothetical protein A2176_04055 [Spirochaetes bacterium RBG_13_51_14]|nr:MAG: hypothetical protein A2176_04055 [Spirochaetes bacterium RBG_13_51_14]
MNLTSYIQKMIDRFGDMPAGRDGSAPGVMPFSRDRLHLIKRLLPWLVGAAILGYLIWRIEYYSLINALSRAHVAIYMSALFSFIILNLFADTHNLYALLKHTKNRTPFGDCLIIRGASYLLMIVDYTLGMGSIAYYLKRLKNIPLARGTGLMFLFNYTTHTSLLLVALAGCLLAVDAPPPWLKQIAVTCTSLLAFSIVFVIALKLLPDRTFFRKLKQSDLVKDYIESSLGVYVINILYRGGFYFTFIIFFYVAVRAFNMDIPFMALILYVPVILLIISMPISAFGLGTSQAAMLILFKNYGTPAQVLAFSLAYSASIIIVRGVIGACFYGIITRRISNKRSESLIRSGIIKKSECNDLFPQADGSKMYAGTKN